MDSDLTPCKFQRLSGTIKLPDIPLSGLEKTDHEVEQQTCRTGEHGQQQAGNDEQMPDVHLPRVVRLPQSDQQTKRQVIEPAGEQHLFAPEKIFETCQRKKSAFHVGAGEVQKSKYRGRNQQNHSGAESDRLGVASVGSKYEQQPGKKNKHTGVPVKIIGRHESEVRA